MQNIYSKMHIASSLVGSFCLLLWGLFPQVIHAQSPGKVSMVSQLNSGEELTISTLPGENYMVSGASRIGSNVEDGYQVTRYKVTTPKALIIEGNLTHLSLAGNSLSSLDASQCPTLKSLYCDLNEITQLTLGAQSSLEDLDFSDNQVEAIDLKGCLQLRNLLCNNNHLKSLDLSKNASLESLFCNGNLIENILFAKNEALVDFYAMSNNLTQVDFSQIPHVMDLNLYYNEFTEINLSALKEVRKVNLSRNMLTSLDLSACTKLRKISADRNKLQSLALPQNAPLKSISCYMNQMDGKAMRQLIQFLPTIDRSDLDIDNGEGDVILIDTSKSKEKNECFIKDVAAAKTKNWRIIDLNGDFDSRKPYEGTQESTPQPSGDLVRMTLDIPIGEIFTFTATTGSNGLLFEGLTLKGKSFIEENTYQYTCQVDKPEIVIRGDLLDLNIEEQKIRTIDIDQASQIASLSLPGNKIERLSVHTPSSIKELWAAFNQLKEINLDNLSELERMDFSENQLSTLDLSKNKNPFFLACAINKISGENMTRMVESLPELDPSNINREDLQGVMIIINLDRADEEKNIATKEDIKKALDKNWIVYAEKGSDFVEYDGSPIGIEGIVAPAIEMYPNPVQKELHIEHATPNARVRLFDLSGKAVRETRTDSDGSAIVSVEGFRSGTYLLMIKEFAYKVIVK